jgi:hypothetical protein
VRWRSSATTRAGRPSGATCCGCCFEADGFAERLVDRDEYAARVVQSFRGRSDAYLKHPVAIDLVDALARRSARFRALWEAQDVRRTDTDTLAADLPGGRVAFTLVNLQGVATPGIRFNAYLPQPASSRPGTGS